MKIQHASAHARTSEPCVPELHARAGAKVALAAATLVIAALCTYAGTLSGPFIYDDQQAIVDNTSLHSLGRALSPPRETPVAARPLTNLSFAVDYLLFGASPTAFHATNLAIHVLCVLLVFATLRRLLRTRSMPDAIRRDADAFAFSVALLFCVHPLAVEIVLYATQRTEVLVAFWYLAVLFLLVRESELGKPSWPWVFVVSLCGVASKEVFVTAPVVALCCDRAFLAGSFRAALRARARFYAALVLPLFALIPLQRPDPRPGSVRFAELDYLIAQARIVPEYFGAALWPERLAIDYGPLWPQDARALWPWIALTGAVLALGAVLAVLRPRLGFLACWVFVILAPSSSLFSIHTEVGAERRFYLPLIGLLAYLVIGLGVAGSRALGSFGVGAAQCRRCGLLVAIAAAVLLGVLTRQHTANFASVQALWESATNAKPDNVHAHYNLAETFRRQGQPELAIASLRNGLAAHEAYADAHTNLGGLLIAKGSLAEGLAHVKRGVALAPYSALARYNLGLALGLSGDIEGALVEFERTLRLQPDHWEARRKLVRAYLALGRRDQALPHARALRAHAPGDPLVREALGAQPDSSSTDPPIAR
jgi:tetratricopeptide (TPR) repeat protein